MKKFYGKHLTLHVKIRLSIELGSKKKEDRIVGEELEMLKVKITFETIVEGKKIKYMQRTRDESTEYGIKIRK
jgi:hypothetical protein